MIKFLKTILWIIVTAIVIGGLITLFNPTYLDDNVKDVVEYNSLT
jgi:hypothetical protein